MNKEIDIDEVPIYTSLTFQNDDITITIKNIALEQLQLFNNKEFVVNNIMYEMWFMYGCYDTAVIKDLGIEVIILSRTKKKIELMVKR